MLMFISESGLKVLLISFVGLPFVDIITCEFHRMPSELHCIISVVVPGRSSGWFNLNYEAASRSRG